MIVMRCVYIYSHFFAILRPFTVHIRTRSIQASDSSISYSDSPRRETCWIRARKGYTTQRGGYGRTSVQNAICKSIKISSRSKHIFKYLRFKAPVAHVNVTLCNLRCKGSAGVLFLWLFFIIIYYYAFHCYPVENILRIEST